MGGDLWDILEKGAGEGGCSCCSAADRCMILGGWISWSTVKGLYLYSSYMLHQHESPMGSQGVLGRFVG